MAEFKKTSAISYGRLYRDVHELAQNINNFVFYLN